MTTITMQSILPMWPTRAQRSARAERRRNLRRERDTLLSLDDRMLKDIGITRDMARREAREINYELRSHLPFIRQV